MPLTDLAIRRAAPRERAYKLADERGLFLFVSRTGAKSFRFKYRFGGKEKLMTFGLYPEVKLTEARERRDAARILLRTDRDPANGTVSLKMPAFLDVARDWHKREAARWSARHSADVLQSLEREVFVSIGDKPIDTIGTADVRNLLSKVEARGAIETAGRVRQRIEAVFAFAIASGFTDQNPGKTVQGAMARRPRASPQPAIV